MPRSTTPRIRAAVSASTYALLATAGRAARPRLLSLAWTAALAAPLAHAITTAPDSASTRARAGQVSPAAAIAEIERTLDARLIRPDLPAPPGLAAQMQQFSLPAVSIAVIRNGEIHWARAWGEARAGVPATPDTRFSAGSISKPVGALAALRLAEARGISIDADLRPMLKRWQPAAEDGPPRYTLRRLLSHSASLTTHGFGGYAADAPLPTIEQILDGLPPANSPAVRPLVPAVKGFKYSGGGSTIVQLWVEEQTGQPYAQAMQTWVLQPLGMRQSSFEQPPREALDQHAFSHQGIGKPEPGGWRVYPEKEAAGLWTTPSDLARMLIAVHKARSAGTVGTDATGSGPLSGSVARTATQRETESTSPGFFLDGRRFGHNGSNQGFESLSTIDATSGDGLVIMINSQNSWPLMDAIARTVARIYGWPELAAPRAAASQRLPQGAGRWAGRYTLADGNTLVVRAAQGALWLQPGPGSWERLIRMADGRFTTEQGQIRIGLSASGLRMAADEYGNATDERVLVARTPRTAALPSFSLRGSPNGWQPGPALQPVGPGRWAIEMDLPAGRHEFKLGDANWQQVDLGGLQYGRVVPGEWTPLRRRGANLGIDVPADGRWRVELDAPDRPVPARLRLTRLAS